MSDFFAPYINRGSYTSVQVLLNLLNKLHWGKEIKREACRAFSLFLAMSLIKLKIQSHEC